LTGFLGPTPALQWGLTIAALVVLIGGGLLLFQNIRLRQQMTQAQAKRDELQHREPQLQKQPEDQRSANSATEQEPSQGREEQARLEEELKRSGRQGDGPVVASLILTPQLRGAAQIHTVSVPANTTYVAVRLELEPNNSSAYRVALLDQSGNRIFWRSGKLDARVSGDDQSVDVRFRAALLKPRTIYLLQVTGVSTTGASEIVGDYPFRVK
jgi:hypothetical protein